MAAAAQVQISSSLCCHSSSRDISALSAAKNCYLRSFPAQIWDSIRHWFFSLCEQSSKEGNGLHVWLGRLPMVGFASAISVKIAAGKGLLENFGFTNPLPTVALAVTVLVGVLTAVFIFQSASEN